MNAEDRRKKITKILEDKKEPISASSLAHNLSVSRQVVVGDVALLRAAGLSILATPKGYVLEDSHLGDYPYIGLLACKHGLKSLKDELYTIVDYGGTVIDVIVEHTVYGELSGNLNISSRYDADEFISQISLEDTRPLLSNLTGGIHLHHIGCKNQEAFNIIKNKLLEKNISL